MEIKYCQSCGMSLQNEEDFGTNHDGSKNEEYCNYCYQKGEYTSNYTMEEMIQHCAQFVDEFNKDSGSSYSKEEAIIGMRKYFPTLKRWSGK